MTQSPTSLPMGQQQRPNPKTGKAGTGQTPKTKRRGMEQSGSSSGS
eukprot:CAMPEP_0182853526 /NCGR_PEP_ID=MMETSP0034_2-20130328/749_1 /TAXON_ID=156128 /ORGANISM="Nephroselmis pyriformis, Strain CCMP717" /LENGTH=45 /DNA_ID= /DNA_START= /DNA_END= /DNA_ORIENTATION=